MGPIVWVVFLVLTFYFFTNWLIRFRCMRNIINRIHGPRSYYFIGNLYQVQNDPKGIHGADEAQAVLSSKNTDKGPEYGVMQHWLGNGLLTSSASNWRSRRKCLTPAFHFHILKDFIKIFNSQSQTLLKRLAPLANGKSTVNVFRINELASRRIKQPWMWSDVIYNIFGKGQQNQKALHKVKSFSAEVIKRRIKERNFEETSKSSAFLDLLLQLVDDGKMNQSEVQDEIDTVMFAGHESTTVSLNWVIHLLATTPKCQQKLIDQVDEIFGDDNRDVTFDDLSKLDYPGRCFKEALRLFPAVPLFSRSIKQEFNIGEYQIPVGTQVLINPAVIHRDPEHWPDPDIFDPDRFLPDNSQGRHPFAYIPFSAGNRNCIGQRFALMEEKVVLAQFFRYFKVESAQRRDEVIPYAALTMKPKEGVKVILTQRRPLPNHF